MNILWEYGKVIPNCGMSNKRKFTKEGYIHIFQITVDRGIIFCTVQDFILIFTLISSRARKYGIHIVAITIMLNHFHIEAQFKFEEDVPKFMNEITSVFAKKYNRQYKLSGKVFHKPFGSSPKNSSPKYYENYLYIANNAREKLAVDKSEDYRWNFLKYIDNPNPFSDTTTKDVSDELWHLMEEVNRLCRKGKAIDYSFFDDNRYASLSVVEKQQLIDYIIVTYNVIDYSFALAKYGSYEKICTVLSLIAGADHSTNDDFDRENYKHYYAMIKIAEEEGYDMRKIRYVGKDNKPGSISPSIYYNLLRRFRKEVHPSNREIIKFFHLPKDTKIV